MAGDRRGRGHADRGPHRVRQDAGGLPGRHRPALPGRRDRPGGRAPDRGRLRVAPQGARRRHPREPGSPARRDPGGRARARAHGPPAPRGRPHGRHARARPRGDAPAAAASPDHDARVLVPARHRGPEPRTPPPGADGDRGRDPRGGARQARRPPGAHAGAARGPRRPATPAHRPVGDPAADRDDRAAPRRRGAGAQPVRRHPGLPGRRPRPRARPRARHRAARQRAGGGRLPRAVGRDPRPDRCARPGAPDDARLRQHAPARRAGGPPPRRAARRGPGRRPSWQPLQGSPAAARGAPAGR